MALKLIRPTEAMTVAHPKLLVYGPPGIGKSTLKNMSRRLLSQDFDSGEHRVQNRQTTVQPEAWADVDELLSNVGLLSEYETLGADTIGRCIDLLSYDIIERNPKHGRGGVLSQQGWGELKVRFKGFKERLDRTGKDVVWIAHEKEEKDGETRIVRPDIQGSSYGLLLQSADLVAYYHKDGKERVLSFEPTERWHAKGPAGWGRIVVPDYDKAPTFLSDLLDRARKELGQVSAQSAEIAHKVADWAAMLDMVEKPEELTDLVPKMKGLEPPILLIQLRELVSRKAHDAGWSWDKGASQYVVKEKATA